MVKQKFNPYANRCMLLFIILISLRLLSDGILEITFQTSRFFKNKRAKRLVFSQICLKVLVSCTNNMLSIIVLFPIDWFMIATYWNASKIWQFPLKNAALRILNVWYFYWAVQKSQKMRAGVPFLVQKCMAKIAKNNPSEYSLMLIEVGRGRKRLAKIQIYMDVYGKLIGLIVQR